MMTGAQQQALTLLREANGQIVKLHVAKGDALVKQGYATKEPLGGYGRLMGGYRLKPGV